MVQIFVYFLGTFYTTTAMTRIQHSSPKKNRLIGALMSGKTITQAAETADIPYGTAKKIIAKYRATGSTSNQPRSGRPSKVDDRVKRDLIRNARNNRRKPFAQLGREVEPQLGATTVRVHLAEEGYHRRVARKVPYLNKVHKKKRLEWGRRNRRTAWDTVIWSDECYVYLDDSRGRVFVTRTADKEFEEDCLIPTFKQSSLRVMVWGCIMKGKKGPLIVLEYPGGRGGGMNAARYQEQVLEGSLLQFWDAMKSERPDLKFQQDGAPAHTARTTGRWLKDHDITIFPHPPSSPDFNAIEPVWHELKKIIRALPHHPTSVPALKKAVKDAWEAIDIKDIDKYINRMPKVVEAVLEAKGGHTRF